MHSRGGGGGVSWSAVCNRALRYGHCACALSPCAASFGEESEIAARCRWICTITPDAIESEPTRHTHRLSGANLPQRGLPRAAESGAGEVVCAGGLPRCGSDRSPPCSWPLWRGRALSHGGVRACVTNAQEQRRRRAGGTVVQVRSALARGMQRKRWRGGREPRERAKALRPRGTAAGCPRQCGSAVLPDDNATLAEREQADSRDHTMAHTSGEVATKLECRNVSWKSEAAGSSGIRGDDFKTGSI